MQRCDSGGLLSINIVVIQTFRDSLLPIRIYTNQQLASAFVAHAVRHLACEATLRLRIASWATNFVGQRLRQFVYSRRKYG